MWLELDLSCVGSELRVAARGQRGEQTAPRSIGLDLEAVRSFASAVRSAAARGRPLPADATEAARALHRAVLSHDIELIRARLAEAAGGPLLIRLSLHDAELQAPARRR